MIRFKCPHCGRDLKASEAARGRNLHCPTCSGDLVIPDRTPQTDAKGGNAGRGTSTSTNSEAHSPKVKVRCPHCHRAFAARRSMLGKELACPACSTSFHLQQETLKPQSNPEPDKAQRQACDSQAKEGLSIQRSTPHVEGKSADGKQGMRAKPPRTLKTTLAAMLNIVFLILLCWLLYRWWYGILMTVVGLVVTVIAFVVLALLLALCVHWVGERRKTQLIRTQSGAVDDQVQFTVYRPEIIPPDIWQTMLAFAHRSQLPRDTAQDAEYDPIVEVARQAQNILGECVAHYQSLTQDSSRPVPRDGCLRFVPHMDGIEFNPTSRSFLWEEGIHREEFRFRAANRLDGTVARGGMTVFLGNVQIAEITLSIKVSSAQAVVLTRAVVHNSSRPYRKIFASYSHKDLPIVREFERFGLVLGDEFVRDWTHLRSGELWCDRLQQMIQEANVFQLFWSWNAMESAFVRKEWEFALSLGRPNFIRPVFWEEPMPEKPEQDLPPEQLRRFHFHKLESVAAVPRPPSAGRGNPEPMLHSVFGNHPEAAIPLLCGIFAFLKLTGVIGWSWWWVFSPLWALLLIILTTVTVGLPVLGIIWLVRRFK